MSDAASTSRYWLGGLVGVVVTATLILFGLRACETPPEPPPDPPPEAGADLSIQKEDDAAAAVRPGRRIVYRLTYANRSTRAASSVFLTETVPAGTSFDADSSDAAWQCDGPGAGSTCRLDLGTVAANGQGAAAFAVVLNDPAAAGLGTVFNRASISAPDDPVPDNNTAAVRTPVDTAVVAPPPRRPALSGFFCEVCREMLGRGVVVAQRGYYERQCNLCPAPSISNPAGGYTLVVLSTPARAEAEAAARTFRTRLADENLPVTILEGVVDGVPRYRVGIGQLPTVADAMALRSRLGDAVPRDAWVLRRQ